MKSLYSISIVLIFLTGCQNQTERRTNSLKDIQKLEWLLATWKDSSAEGQLFEIWNKISDTVYKGQSFMLVKNDTVFYETIALQQRDSGLFYTPIVRNQNEGKSVSFKLVSDSAGEFVFENKAHDFPQRIIYKNPRPDSLYARIEGEDNGRFRKEEFRLTK
jgi:hypothetical protein